MNQIIDLRSDTVTRPTPAMREAMAHAEVGDDVYGDDPTINRLEAEAAEVFGREASIFVPTGTMGNQIAIRLHTQPGQEIICEAHAHIMDWEMSMTAIFSGCQPRTVAADHGILTWDSIQPAFGPKIYDRAQTGLVCLENTHNMAGGTVSPQPVMQKICDEAHGRGIPVHLDGARIFNAATVLGTPVAELTAGFDTVMFCLSKGLGAPVGSMLVGSREAITRARMHRKALGGGMRQAGILAAAGLIALHDMPARLHEDHANACLLAESIAAQPGAAIDLATVQTNIVIFRIPSDAPAFVATLKQHGVLANATGPHSVRLVTHYDVDREACQQAAAILSEQLSVLVAKP